MGALTLAAWNVNSVKARLGHLCDWLKAFAPDIVLLQELKCQDADFPRLEIESLGYKAEVRGQKSYNGVAVLSRLPYEVTAKELPGDTSDEQARYLEVRLPGCQDLHVGALYLPNGNPPATDKYAYKLAWMDRLISHAKNLRARNAPFVLGGDFNVIPEATDCWDIAPWREDALFLPETRRRYRALMHLGLTDSFRALHPEPGQYSFWDYQAGRWSRGEGIRIDHLLLSPEAADRLLEAGIDKSPRGQEKPSDHTPVWCRLTA